jgi:hypothetical protein
MAESYVSQMRRADEQQTLKDSSHHLIACAGSPIAPLREQLPHAFRDVLRMLAAEYLSCEAGVHDMVALEAMQLSKPAQQVSNGNSVLAGREPGINRIDPFLRGPSPKRSFAFGHLAQKEKQNVLPTIRDDSRIVERVVEWPN